MAKAIDALQLPKCQKFFWCDSKVVLQWLSDRELRLQKFTSRRIDRIFLYSQPHEWHFCPTDNNPADVASRPLGKSISFRINLWLQSASFLNQPGNCLVTHATLHQVGISNVCKSSLIMLSDLIQAAPSWYALKERFAYSMAFTQYMRQKHRKQSFQKSILDALQRLTSTASFWLFHASSILEDRLAVFTQTMAQLSKPLQMFFQNSCNLKDCNLSLGKRNSLGSSFLPIALPREELGSH